MASGKLGSADLAAITYTSIYTVPVGKITTANIRLVNRDQINSVAVRLAICPIGYIAPAVPANADWIEPLDVVLAPGGIIEEIGMPMSAGEQTVAFSSAASVTVRVSGFEA